MSTLWRITVVETGPDWVDLEVLFVHPDAGPFPEDPVFALCLLTDPAYEIDDNSNRIPICPLGEAIPYEESYQPFDVAPRVGEFVRRVLIYLAWNLPWGGEAAVRQTDQNVLGLGIERGSEAWEDAWWEAWSAFWEDRSNLPCANYRVWVTDPKWIEHLIPGLTYDSAAYSLGEGPWVDENRDDLLRDD